MPVAQSLPLAVLLVLKGLDVDAAMRTTMTMCSVAPVDKLSSVVLPALCRIDGACTLQNMGGWEHRHGMVGVDTGQVAFYEKKKIGGFMAIK